MNGNSCPVPLAGFPGNRSRQEATAQGWAAGAFRYHEAPQIGQQLTEAVGLILRDPGPSSRRCAGTHRHPHNATALWVGPGDDQGSYVAVRAYVAALADRMQLTRRSSEIRGVLCPRNGHHERHRVAIFQGEQPRTAPAVAPPKMAPEFLYTSGISCHGRKPVVLYHRSPFQPSASTWLP